VFEGLVVAEAVNGHRSARRLSPAMISPPLPFIRILCSGKGSLAFTLMGGGGSLCSSTAHGRGWRF
ncbi:hypothetical protein NL292_25960, partial [Klebsiella pneumoniae]|nr:hypothetical protein [Klebsiella pneumoniae]